MGRELPAYLVQDLNKGFKGIPLTYRYLGKDRKNTKRKDG